MAKLAMLALCDTITPILMPSGGTIVQLAAPQFVLRPQFIPGCFSFGVSVGIRDMNLHSSFKVSFSIQAPTDRVVWMSGESEFSPTPLSDTLPAPYQGIMVNMDIRNMEVPEEGIYLFTAFVDGNAVGTYEIPIFQRAEL